MVVLTWIEIQAADLAAAERLALLQPGERDAQLIACAAAQFLKACAAAQFLKAAQLVASMGDALWPAGAGNI